MKRLFLDEVVHQKLIDSFHLYLIIDGMSVIVEKYCEANNFTSTKNLFERQHGGITGKT